MQQITMTDADRAQGLLAQVQALTLQISNLLAENATMRRAIIEQQAVEVAKESATT